MQRGDGTQLLLSLNCNGMLEGNNTKELLLPLKVKGVRGELMLNRHGLQELLRFSWVFGARAAAHAKPSTGIVRHVFQFDKHERRKNILHFNVESQRDILLEMSRTEGHDEVDYIYNS